MPGTEEDELMDVLDYNRRSWDGETRLGNPWTIPVDAETVRRARAGEWDLYLTPTRAVPRAWFPDLAGAQVLCLAAGGGQQGPILAAAGARVVVLDASQKQLERDRFVARRDGLEIETVAGNMADLSAFPDGRFDLVAHPVANLYAPDPRPVWREAYRVLRPGGLLFAAFDLPVRHLFDAESAFQGVLRVRHRIPYAEVRDLPAPELRRRMARGEPVVFGHTLEDQLGGQTAAGFAITGFFEDRFPKSFRDPLSARLAIFGVTRSLKPRRPPECE